MIGGKENGFHRIDLKPRLRFDGQLPASFFRVPGYRPESLGLNDPKAFFTIDWIDNRHRRHHSFKGVDQRFKF